MEVFRKLPNNIFFKLFLGILLFTFIFFGVADFIFGSGKYNVAKVGQKQISIGKFYNLLNKERNLLIRNNPNNLDYANSKEFKLQVLDKEINSILLNQATENLHLIPKDSVIIELIVTNPLFAGSDGKFDKQKFNLFLNNLNFTEKEYIKYIKNILTRKVLVSAIANVNMIDDSLAERIYKNRFEKRKVDVVTITEKSLNNKVKQPTEEEIKNFYDSNSKLFYRPEYRQVKYFEIDPIKLFPDEKLVVTDKEIKKEYELGKNEYAKPETRSIYFIGTDSEQKINEAKEKLDNGENFIDVAQKITGLPKENLKVENVSRDSFDAELSNQIFNTEKGAYSNVIARNGDFIIIYVYSITPLKQMTFEEVKDNIKSRLLAQKREEFFSKYIMEIEDKLLLAGNIDEVGKDSNLKVLTVEKFNSEGLNLKGKPITEVSKIKNFVNIAFELNEKTFSDLIFENNKYYVLFLEKVDSEGILAYEDFKDEVKKMLIKDLKDKKVREIANRVAKQLKSTQNTFMVVARNNLELEKNIIIERSNSKYSQDFINSIFNTNSENSITDFYKEDSGVYKIAILKQILKVNNVSKENIEMMKENLNGSIYEDIATKYVEYLKDKMGVSINLNTLQQLE